MLTSPARLVNGLPHAETIARPRLSRRDCIVVRDLSLWYGSFQALDGVSIAIREGDVTGLIGPSGCGKSTLLRSLNRIHERQANITLRGSIEILGRNIHDADVDPGELRRRVGMVFQRPNPLPLSIRDNILFGPRIHCEDAALSRSEDEELVEQSLRQVLLWEELKDRLKSRATALSLEQQQKLCIARALVLRPWVLLMDEPCSALDAAGMARIEELINQLRGEYTVVIVTHNMAQARRVTDECAYMYMGRLIEQRPTGLLFTDAKHEETRNYVSGKVG